MSNVGTIEKLPSPVAEVRDQIDKLEGQFKAALPAHIPAERFARVVMTAIQNNPQLLKAPRRELWNACMKAAQDGLLPDGREGALVCRPGRDGVTVTWQPMIAGVRKKARNSGEIATWDAHVVYETDFFQFQLGDAPQINHTYDLKTERGQPIGAYSVAVMKDGSKSFEVMSVSDINGIRDRSDAYKAFRAGKIKSTPWSTDWGEMARKTVAKRHSKVLPMSTDLDDLIRRDDDLYDMKGAREEATAAAVADGRARSLGGRLDLLAGGAGDASSSTDEDDERPAKQVGDDGDDGSSLEAQAGDSGVDDPSLAQRGKEPPASKKPASDAGGAAPGPNGDRPPQSSNGDGAALDAAYRRGREDQMKRLLRKATPPEFREEGREDELDAWLKGFDASAAVDAEG